MTEIAEPIQAQVASKTFNPFNEAVKARDYTRKAIEADMLSSGEQFDESPIPEKTYDLPSYNEGGSSSASNVNATSAAPTSSVTTEASPISQSTTSPSGGTAAPSPSVNPALDDLDGAAKKKAAKQTAEVMIAAYGKFVPMPFIKIASFNMNKMNKLNMSGVISLDMRVQQDGTTVRSYMEGVNSQVAGIFQVTEDMKKELKEPLIDVLMEQNLALTPTQRLMVAIGGQVVQFGVQSIQLGLQNKEAIKTFKNYTAEAGNSPQKTEQQSSPVSDEPQNSEEAVQEDVVQEDVVQEEDSYQEPVSETESSTTEKEKTYNAPTFGLDEYVDSE